MSEKRVVLVLEDLPGWQDTVRLLLEAKRDKDGEEIYEVIAANSLTSAMTLLHSRIFDVAIVDICLVEGDPTNTEGMTFLDELGRYYADDRTHAIMLSAHGTISLAVDAMKRPYVLDYFEKGAGRFDEDHFVSEVARAWRVTKARRVERDRMRVRPLPSSFLEAVGIPRLAASLAPEMESVAAGKELELLLKNLFLNVLPLTWEVLVTVEPGGDVVESQAHILCWSRKLVRALDIAIGQTEILDSLQPAMRWRGASGAGRPEKLFEWSTRYFSGIIFGLPGIPLEEFLSAVARTT